MVTKNIKITNLTSNRALYGKILFKNQFKNYFLYKGKKHFIPFIPIVV